MKGFPNGSEGSGEGPREEPWSAGVPEGTPKGFGFRTGKRSPRVAHGFAGFRALARQARRRRDG